MFRVVRMDHTRHRYPKAAGGFPWGGAWGRGRAMDATVLGIVGMCLIAVIVGAAQITAWWLDRREYAAGQGARQAIAIAQARAEVRR
ncbi:TPA: hypothetical protein QEN11_04090 [Stenotrophomonas maltophilia]|nr:hypothetical protein [Stenotrophomonas maltophilia]